MTLSLYRAATWLAAPWLDRHLARRAGRGKEDPARLAERRGVAGRPRPHGPLAWLHAASVGEAQAALALVRRLLDDRPTLSALVTTGTVTSAQLLADRLPARALHQYAPLDRRPWIAAFLDHWRPDVALWMESELWPNMVLDSAARGIPLALVNGRMSPGSARRWHWLPGLIRPMLSSFDPCLAVSDAQAAQLHRLGARSVRVVGNLKAAAQPLPADPEALATLTQRIGGRPLWLAASLRDGEAPLVPAVHRRLAKRMPGLLSIVVPRHPGRAAAIEETTGGAGLALARRSTGALPDAATDVYLADTLGEMGLFYRLAPVVFVGGSLVPAGGHNPIEPAHFDCAIVHGNGMAKNRDLADMLIDAGASIEADTLEAAADAVARLMTDPEERARRAGAGRAAVERQLGVMDQIAAALAPLIDPVAPAVAATGAIDCVGTAGARP